MSSPRVVTLIPGLVARIEECWHPSHFRDVLKSVRNCFKMTEHLKVVVVRLDTVIEISANIETLDTLKEMREEIMSEIANLEDGRPDSAPQKHFNMHKKQMRILNGEKVNFQREKPIKEQQILGNNSETITKELTLQVYEECKRDLFKCSTRLGISIGVLVNRLKAYKRIL